MPEKKLPLQDLQNIVWDVVVIGGGPAGMMCAGIAAARGLSVLLLEKNPILGKKLRITGGGRCNITNATFDTRALLAKYQEAEQFLFSAFSKHDVQDTLDFFHTKNLLTKIEAENRVFPISEKAEDVAETLVAYLKQTGVTVVCNTTVLTITREGNHISGILTKSGTYHAKNYVVATGGISRPETGSTGDGYRWLSELSHHVTPPTPSLVPITLKEKFVERLAGITLKDTQISIYQNNLLIKKTSGNILFTHNGLSGPGILNSSAQIGDSLEYGPVVVKINLVSKYTEESLVDILKEASVLHANKKIKNVLTTLLPESFVDIVLDIAGIDLNKTCNTITRTERHILTQTLRGLPLTVDSLLGPDKAIIASGGVDIKEIDFRTMQSRLFNNLYIIGDVLNINRPSGGYSLQLCWTTGFVAGTACGQ